MENVNNQQSNC